MKKFAALLICLITLSGCGPAYYMARDIRNTANNIGRELFEIPNHNSAAFQAGVANARVQQEWRDQQRDYAAGFLQGGGTPGNFYIGNRGVGYQSYPTNSPWGYRRW